MKSRNLISLLSSFPHWLHKAKWHCCKKRLPSHTVTTLLSKINIELCLLIFGFYFPRAIFFQDHAVKEAKFIFFNLQAGKVIHSEKATKFERNIPLILTLLSKCQETSERSSQIVWPSQKTLTFNSSLKE